MNRQIRTLTCCTLLAGALALGQLACKSSDQSNNTANPNASPAMTPAVAQTQVPAVNPAATAVPGTSVVPAVTATPIPVNNTKPAALGTPTAMAPQSPASAPPPPRTFTLAKGRVVSVSTATTLSSKTHKAGDTFTASLLNPITDGDWVIAKRGAAVEGVVVNSDPGGKVKGRATIAVALKRLTLADGRRIELDTGRFTQEARGTKKKDAMKIGGGAALGAVIGAIAGGGKGAAIGAAAGGGAGTGLVLATRGEPAVIPSESTLTFRLTAPVKVTKR